MYPWSALIADTYRQFGRFNIPLLVKGAFTRRTFRPIVTLRLCQGIAHSRGIIRITLPAFIFLHHITAHNAAIDLHWRTEIEGGFIITHGWGLVVSPGAKIGKNVTLFHGVTIGRRDRISSDNGSRFTEYPVIEDEVWIGPNAIIVCGIVIGRGSRIGGGAFVTDDIPPYSVVTGNPAVITDNNCTPDVMNPAPMMYES
jgi:serine O-acetyltransferase